MTPKFIFWDCDSTLLDNSELHWQKHVAIASRHGVTLDCQYRPVFYHNNGEQNWHMMVRELGFHVPMVDYLREIDEWYHAKILEIPLRPGVGQALEYFKSHDVHQCVVTNARGASVRPMIENKQLMRYFDFILAREDYPERKPHPAPYLTAHARMEALTSSVIDKEVCLAVEDDPYGVESAIAAGIPVVHRRLQDDLPPVTGSVASVYSEEDFLAVILP